MSQLHELIQATLASHVAPDASLVELQQRKTGPQGYSGATLRYYDVTYARAGVLSQVVLVVKDAPLVERRTLAWLDGQGLPLPFSHTLDLSTAAPADVCMQYLDAQPAPAGAAAQVAGALAAVHAAGLRRRGELSWLPHAEPGFAAEWIVDACWRRSWQQLLAGGEFVDAYGRSYGPSRAGGDFAAEFGAYTGPLEQAAQRLVGAVERLWAEGDSLTLIHADFHHDHVLFAGDAAYLIDWGTAHYGPLYLDLPNYFSREQALLYHEALAERGHAIAPEQFLRCYDAVRAYPGFKYFGIGLYNWCHGDPPHQRDYVLHFINMVLEPGA